MPYILKKQYIRLYRYQLYIFKSICSVQACLLFPSCNRSLTVLLRLEFMPEYLLSSKLDFSAESILFHCEAYWRLYDKFTQRARAIIHKSQTPEPPPSPHPPRPSPSNKLIEKNMTGWNKTWATLWRNSCCMFIQMEKSYWFIGALTCFVLTLSVYEPCPGVTWLGRALSLVLNWESVKSIRRGSSFRSSRAIPGETADSVAHRGVQLSFWFSWAYFTLCLKLYWQMYPNKYWTSAPRMTISVQVVTADESPNRLCMSSNPRCICHDARVS